MEDIISLLQSKISGFSKRQQAISKYIIENCDSASFMTAGRLAEEVGVSESTVVRFSKELGYDGYPQLRKVLQDVVRGKFNADRVIYDTEGGEMAGDLLSGAVESDIEKLRSARSHSNTVAFMRALEAVFSAERVYVAGAASFMGLALYFRQGLSSVRRNVFPADFNIAASELAGMKAGDALLLIGSDSIADFDGRLIFLAEESFAQIVTVGFAPGISHIELEAESPAAIVSVLDALLQAAEQYYGPESRIRVEKILRHLSERGEYGYE